MEATLEVPRTAHKIPKRRLSEPPRDIRPIASAVEDQIIAAARKDPAVFAEYALGLELCRMHREWYWIVENHIQSAIFGPRGHGKTTLMSVGYPIWRLGKNPNLRIKIGAQSDSKAMQIVGEISTNIETNKRIHKVFPDLMPDYKQGWSKTQLFVQRSRIMKDPSVEAAGVLSAITGGRFDLFIADDLVDYKNAIQIPALRRMVHDTFYTNWLNLADSDASEVIYIATLWTDADLSYHILTKDSQPNGSFYVKLYRIDEDFNPLWEKKWSKEALKSRCKKLGWFSYNRAFRNIVVSADDAIFDKTSIDNMRTAGVGRNPEDYLTCPKYMGVDLAIGRGKQACFTCVFVVALTPEKKRVPVDIVKGHMTSPQTARLIYDKFNMWHPDSVRVENNAYQQAIIDWMAELIPDMPVEAHFTGAQKLDLNIGIPSLGVEMSHGLWVLPQGSRLHADACQCTFCQWVSELRTFPYATTDMVLASWLAREAARQVTNKTQAGFAIWDLAGDF